MCLKFEFVIFWQKDFGAKAAHKMLVKLTPGSLVSLAALSAWQPCQPVCLDGLPALFCAHY
jgi:hypothetical protein